MASFEAFGAVKPILPPKTQHTLVPKKTHLANFSSHSSNFINLLVLGNKKTNNAPCTRHHGGSLAVKMAWAGALSSVKLIIQAKNLIVNEALRNYVEQKVGKAVRNFSSLVREVDVRLSVRESGKGPRRRCAVTLYTKRHGVVRAEGDAESTYGTIDLVSSIVQKNLGRIKEKETDHGRHMKGVNRLKLRLADPMLLLVKDVVPDSLPEDAEKDKETAALENEEDLLQAIVGTKHSDVPPLTVTEAIDQLEMADCNFYAFLNEETGEVNALYRREDGGYGIIILKEDGRAEKLEPVLKEQTNQEPLDGAEN